MNEHGHLAYSRAPLSGAAALRGDVKKGLFFRGVGNLPFGSEIRSVRELIERLLTPAALQPA